MSMDYSERTECASLIEIIRVITAKQLLAYHLCCEILMCFLDISRNFSSVSFLLFAILQPTMKGTIPKPQICVGRKSA